MKLPCDINGTDLAGHLVRRWSYIIDRQTGSHIRLRTSLPSEHFVTVPAHRPVKVGTLHSIVKEVATHKQVPVAAVLARL